MDPPLTISSPCGTLMYPTHAAKLDIHSLPQLAVSTLYLNFCPVLSILLPSYAMLAAQSPLPKPTALFTLALTSSNNPMKALWHLDLPAPADTTATDCNIAFPAASNHPANPADLIVFAYAVLFSSSSPLSMMPSALGTETPPSLIN
ncbi:hypothetical protein IV203_032727 [Nitzschia inconspicua]|uniref:Uncharacterized protein n=1 Tax=Nitzschia inconspicua TaxID=303405 RepID=A0A9K3KKW2_9STRA|nr:hypothetical protein IV203_032727 [Nitzschia inconspicua]